jgi:hypothetical protein
VSEHYRFNFENAVANITCACGEEHYLDSQSGSYKCDCGRRFTFSTKIIAEHKAKHIKKAPNYWEDNCPMCGLKCVMACRCPKNDRRCPNGHWWRWEPLVGRPVMLDGPHGSPIDWEQVDENSRSD